MKVSCHRCCTVGASVRTVSIPPRLTKTSPISASGMSDPSRTAILLNHDEIEVEKRSEDIQTKDCKLPLGILRVKCVHTMRPMG